MTARDENVLFDDSDVRVTGDLVVSRSSVYRVSDISGARFEIKVQKRPVIDVVPAVCIGLTLSIMGIWMVAVTYPEVVVGILLWIISIGVALFTIFSDHEKKTRRYKDYTVFLNTGKTEVVLKAWTVDLVSDRINDPEVEARSEGRCRQIVDAIGQVISRRSAV